MTQTVIRCDKCNSEFSAKSLHLEETKVQDLLISFFRCPSCGYAYPIKYTDKQQKEFDEEIKAYTNMIAQRKKLGKAIPAARIRKLNSLLNGSKAYQKALRDKYQTAVTTQLNQSGEIETISITGKEESHEE